LLQRLGVSCAELDALVRAALDAGALGAKLSGAGRGGCIIALVPSPAERRRISAALAAAGARLIIAALSRPGSES
ncbi:MAG: mevalonate kinase, partial [Deltaproteobacteria bacterium]|nr:mevalonate kinase [Deltaproteobacteria bacterium]